ncbi:hypothetical protein HDV04_004738 [Boothiomyces sp. JEL0838]|nr:hypothetical protein HDV04_004738 [Boothiomyces sp. JEL0838]
MQHSQKCPNCRSNIGKLIKLPDEFFIELAVVEQESISPPLVSGSMLDSETLKRLYRDLNERQKQVEQLELELEDARCQIEDIQDSSDSLNEIEKEKLSRENTKCNELSKENSFLKSQLQQTENNLRLVENKLKAFCGMNSISLDRTDIEYEHLSHRELQELVAYNNQKLKTASKEKEMFKEKFLKLKQLSESMKRDYELKIQELQKQENIQPPLNSQPSITRVESVQKVCAPGSKNTKRKFDKFVEKKELRKPVKSVVPVKAWFNR